MCALLCLGTVWVLRSRKWTHWLAAWMLFVSTFAVSRYASKDSFTAILDAIGTRAQCATCGNECWTINGHVLDRYGEAHGHEDGE